VGSLGDYIRDQRKSAQYSLRQLAAAADVSNPYLSQIERGLKKPSAEILQQIAKALRISAETLYVRAGFLEDRGGSSDVVAAILTDPAIGDRHKRVLIDIYESFRSGAVPEAVVKPTAASRPSTSKRTTAKRTTAERTTDRTTAQRTTAKRTTDRTTNRTTPRRKTA
jgi:transcriptional regulator with XRE-family HTH domain